MRLILILLSSFIFATTSVAVELNPAVSTFMQGYDELVLRKYPEAKQKFEKAIEEAALLKPGKNDSESGRPLIDNAKLQIPFFSNYFLAIIESQGGRNDIAAKRMEKMFEYEQACKTKVFVVHPIPGRKEHSVQERMDMDQTLKELGGAMEESKKVMLTCFAYKRKGMDFLGDYYFSQKQFQKSADILTRIIELKDKEGIENVYFKRALDYFILQKHKEAVSDLDMIIPASGAINDKKYATPLALRCAAKVNVYAEGGKKDKEVLLSAEKDCDTAGKLDPNNGYLKEYRGGLDYHLAVMRTGKDPYADMFDSPEEIEERREQQKR